MTIGVAIVLVALILLLIARPGLFLLLCFIGVACLVAFWVMLDSADKKRTEEAAAAHQLALSAIKADDLTLQNVTLGRQPEYMNGEFMLTGKIINNSQYALKNIQFKVTITDCSGSPVPSVGCQTVGQELVSGHDLEVPPKQTREFKTWILTFRNLPDPLRCLDNAPSTWHNFTKSDMGAGDKQTYSECKSGRSYAWEISKIEADGFGY
jgi:hypothetical protein